MVYDKRRAVGVEFLQSDWKDERDEDPAALMATADSLRDTGNVNEAQNYYRKLSSEFAFTDQGRKAYQELAKIQTEKQTYREAITNYRRYLLFGREPDRLCNTFFMIGFIYDEYMDKPDLAEVNYTWVLKHTPDCELADDAEFMMLHLGEQMAGVDELQAEVKRQGKKVEDTETDTAGLKVEMMPVKK
jgi:outer membrane protein assembly factor BamD (BamD/ComL family)